MSTDSANSTPTAARCVASLFNVGDQVADMFAKLTGMHALVLLFCFLSSSQCTPPNRF
jgi:hypothetical protein